ncbi:MAG: hypothetical protein QM683_17710 [Lacrimispora sp.]
MSKALEYTRNNVASKMTETDLHACAESGELAAGFFEGIYKKISELEAKENQQLIFHNLIKANAAPGIASTSFSEAVFSKRFQ